MSLIAPNALWALDFQFDTTVDGRTLKMLNVIDEYTPEALAVDVAHSITADDVVACLDRLAIARGRPPAFVRFDNGPEFVAVVVAEWCAANGTQCVFIDPGSPWQNAWIESFNSRLRDELLNLWQFDSLLEAQVIIEDWRIDDNSNRPHSAHGALTPNEFTQARTINHQPQPAYHLDHSPGPAHSHDTPRCLMKPFMVLPPRRVATSPENQQSHSGEWL